MDLEPASLFTGAPDSIPAGEAFAIYDARRDFSRKDFKSACYAPFVTLDFFTTGHVQVCCENHNFPVGNVRTQSLRDIWKGPRIQQLREALRRYDFSLGCQTCELAIRRGGRPFAADYEWPWVDALHEWPRLMQFRLSNVCNFACIMCDGEHSATIRRLRERKDPLAVAYDERFFNDLWEFIPHLDSMMFSGGEPLLIKENFRIWDMLLEIGNTNTSLSIITNGSIWNDRIAHYLERINLTHLTISLDGATKDTFEAVRIGSNFDVVMENLKHFAASAKQVRPRSDFYGTSASEFSFSFCLTPINFHEMPDVFLLAEDWGADVYVNLQTVPGRCSFVDAPYAPGIFQAHEILTHAYDRLTPRLSPVNRMRYVDALANLRGLDRQLKEGAPPSPRSF